MSKSNNNKDNVTVLKSAKSSGNITMVNPKNNAKVITNQQFQPQWEQLGFIPTPNVIFLRAVV